MKLQGVGGWAKVRVGKGRNKGREGTMKEGFAVGKEMKKGGMEENKKGMEGNHSIMEVMIIIGRDAGEWKSKGESVKEDGGDVAVVKWVERDAGG